MGVGVSACPMVLWEGSPLWTEWLTHACENITFPQLHLRAVTIKKQQKNNIKSEFQVCPNPVTPLLASVITKKQIKYLIDLV